MNHKGINEGSFDFKYKSPRPVHKQMKHHVVTYISGVCAVQINREPLLTKLIDLQISCVHLIGICDFPTVGEALIGTRISYLWILHGIIELVQ